MDESTQSKTESKSALSSLLVRNIIFGVEDSLVSTVGLLAGIATSATPVRTILVTGVIYIFVEGYSMAAGSYLSEHSAQEYETGARVKNNEPLIGAVVMFLSFIIAGIIPLAPYLLFGPGSALAVSVIASLIFLGILGYVHGKVSKVARVPNIIRMVVVGGIAIVLGIVIGKLFGVS